MSRARRAGLRETASRQHQVLLTSASTSSPRLITVVKSARAPSTFSAITSATTKSSRKVGAAVFDLVAERDPQVPRNRVGRGDLSQ